MIANRNIDDVADPMTPAELAASPTIPDLFEIMRDALDRDVPHISVSYDPDFGYLFIDFNATQPSDDLECAVDGYVAVE